MGIRLTGFADEISPRFERQLEVAEATGVKAIEIRGVDGRGIQQWTPKEAEGLFSSRYIRMFSFYVPEGGAAACEDEVLRRTERLVKEAAKRGVMLLHENEKGIYGDVAPRCLRLMERFAGDSYRAVFDFANFVQCGQDTLEAYDLLRLYIEYIHIKDAKRGSGQVTPAGEGDGHVRAILGKLKDGGWEGYLSLEPHLADFTGFSLLEKDAAGKERKPMDGETAWKVALDALKAILRDLDWAWDGRTNDG